MNIMKELHESEITAFIIANYGPKVQWHVGSPFNPDKATQGVSASVPEAEADMTKAAIVLFPESNFAETMT